MKDAATTSIWSRLPILGPVVRSFQRKAADGNPSGDPPCPGVKTYHCGTLTYTKAGVIALFAWLMWGDFCWTVMETVVPSVMPLKLEALACPHWVMGLILTTLPAILNMTLGPAVSFKSDRHRGRWGRRIPFIAWTLPFLVLSLVLLGYSENIGDWLQAHMVFLRKEAPATVTLAVIGVFMVAFQFFNMFVNSVFWYLFNDVVPAQLMSRLIAMFKIVGLVATSLFNWFIFQYAGTHMKEILVGAALLYFVAFTLLCIMVREGEYPPLEGEEAGESRGLRGVKTFLKESYSHKWYWLYFVWQNGWTLGGGIGIFTVFFNLEMGLSLRDIGRMASIAAVVAAIMIYGGAVFAERWHPLRVTAYIRIFWGCTAFTPWVWIFVTLPGKAFFWLTLISGGTMGAGLLWGFIRALYEVTGYPLQMRVFPKSRFGQFCSAQAMLRGVFQLASGVLSGLFVDGVAWLYRNSGKGHYFVYRFNFIWAGLFVAFAGVVSVWVYAHWHRLGGENNYQPPAPWSPKGTEEMENLPTVAPQARWLSLSLRLFDAVMWLSVLGLPAMIWWMQQRGADVAARWTAILVLPFSLAVWIAWKFLERGIRRDMARCLNHEPLRNGIPHHGLLMVFAISSLLNLGIWVAQVIMTVKLNMEWECILFGVANAINNLTLIVFVLTVWRMERGISTTLEAGVGKEKDAAPSASPAA